MKTYKSKIGLELIIPVFILLSVVGSLNAYAESWPGLVVVICVALFIMHMFLTTYYQLNGEQLIIRCGFIINKTLAIRSITKIEETNNPASSPATSLDRLEIYYNKFDSVIISPKDKQGFITDLKTINPAIVVRLKNNRKVEVH